MTVDAGKQVIRWGKADLINPTDRFAPRDFLNVVDTEFLAVTGVRAVAQLGAETFEVVWVPRFTPSRVPLVDQRWTPVPAQVASIPIVDAGSVLPPGSETGLRWSHIGAGFEYSVSFFDGFNHLPNIQPSLAPTVAVSASYTDTQSGVASSSIQLLNNGALANSSLMFVGGGFSGTIALSPGLNSLQLTVKDNAGNTTTQTHRVYRDTANVY